MGFVIPPPPDGSHFKIDTDDAGEPRVSWSFRTGWFGGLVVVFLSVWLVFWAAGEVFVMIRLVAPRNAAAPPGQFDERTFLITWLVGWSLGGLAAMRVIYGVVRPKKERVTFGISVLACEPGSCFFGTLIDTNRIGNVRLFKRKRTVKVNRSEIRQVCIDRVDYYRDNRPEQRQRLRLVYAEDELELGAMLRDDYREWVGRVLADYAGVPLEVHC